MGVERNRIRKPDLAELRDLPRAEAMRVAMIKYGWDAETAGRMVAAEQRRRALEGSERKIPRSA